MDEIEQRIQEMVGDAPDQIAGLYILCNIQRIALHQARDSIERLKESLDAVIKSGDALTTRLAIPKDADVAMEEMVSEVAKRNPALKPEQIRQLFGDNNVRK